MILYVRDWRKDGHTFDDTNQVQGLSIELNTPPNKIYFLFSLLDDANDAGFELSVFDDAAAAAALIAVAVAI